LFIAHPQKINHEEPKKTKKEQKIFVPFVSSWLIFILSGRRQRRHKGSSEKGREPLGCRTWPGAFCHKPGAA